VSPVDERGEWPGGKYNNEGDVMIGNTIFKSMYFMREEKS
jgi:hypothetical protein